MLDPKTNLRMFLSFPDGLSEVQVIAPRHPAGLELCIMGIVEGREDLLDLFETVDVDHFIMQSGGEVFSLPTFTAYERSSKSIVQDLDKHFQTADEIPLKILRGEQLTEEEESFTRCMSLHVGSSSVEGVEGVKRVHEWFESKKVLA